MFSRAPCARQRPSPRGGWRRRFQPGQVDWSFPTAVQPVRKGSTSKCDLWTDVKSLGVRGLFLQLMPGVWLWAGHLAWLKLGFLINKDQKSVPSASREFYGNQEIMCPEVLCKLKITNQILETIALVLPLIFSASVCTACLSFFPMPEVISRYKVKRASMSSFT